MTAVDEAQHVHADQLAGVNLERTPRRLAAYGIALIVLVVAIIAVIVESISGNFTNYVAVTAELPSSGNAIQIDSPVQYRDVTVGSVASSGHPVGGGAVTVAIHLKPSKLAAIPATVRATVGPLSIFGNQAIQLVAPSTPSTSGEHLAAEIGR